MPTEILVALLSLLGTLAGSFTGVLASQRITQYRIGQLEKKVDKHNNLIDRMYKMETEVEVIAEKIDVANHRIKDLEEDKP